MDWNNMQTWQYLALIAGGVLLLGVVLHFLPVGKLKIPSIVTAVFAALAVGLATGIIFMSGFGYKPYTPESDAGGDEGAESKMGKAMPKMAMGGMGGMPKGGGGGMPKGGFGGGPNPRMQLAALVATLDNVVDRPVTVTLTPEDKTAIAEQLKGLDTQTEIKDEDAKARLDAILKVVAKERKSLEAMGYRWPGAGGKGGFGPPKDNPNPFKEGGPSADRLKSLMDRLAKK